MGAVFSIFWRRKSRNALEQELNELDNKISTLEEQEKVLVASRRWWLYMLALLCIGALVVASATFYWSALRVPTPIERKLYYATPIIIDIVS